jgi:hypothetical protein
VGDCQLLFRKFFKKFFKPRDENKKPERLNTRKIPRVTGCVRPVTRGQGLGAQIKKELFSSFLCQPLLK